MNVFVYLLGNLVTIVPLLADFLAQKYQFLALSESARPELVAHSEFGDHLSRKFRGFLEVVLCSGGDIAELQLLGCAPSEQSRNLVVQL